MSGWHPLFGQGPQPQAKTKEEGRAHDRGKAFGKAVVAILPLAVIAVVLLIIVLAPRSKRRRPGSQGSNRRC